MFADLVGYTALSESIEPNVQVRILNGYFERMSRAITDQRGHVSTLIGDGARPIRAGSASARTGPEANERVSVHRAASVFIEGIELDTWGARNGSAAARGPPSPGERIAARVTAIITPEFGGS